MNAAGTDCDSSATVSATTPSIVDNSVVAYYMQLLERCVGKILTDQGALVSEIVMNIVDTLSREQTGARVVTSIVCVHCVIALLAEVVLVLDDSVEPIGARRGAVSKPTVSCGGEGETEGIASAGDNALLWL